jgi:hypothetical protein
MKLNKLQKRIMIFLIALCLIAPIGILLPMFFNAGDAWGEWSADTIKNLIGYVPQQLAKYSEIWHAPLADYSVNGEDPSDAHQSGYYIVCGIVGATLTYISMLFLSKLIIKHGK